MLNNRKWFTPIEVREIVFDGLISLSTVQRMCRTGEIPCEKSGSSVTSDGRTRKKFLIPASYVKEMIAKSGADTDGITL